MTNYEGFKPIFERIVKEGGLESYIANRVSGRKEYPSLENRFGSEVPAQILWEFAESYPEIYETARKMLINLEADSERAQDGEYGWGLSYLLAGHDADSKKIALDLLLTKGRPVLPEPYFAEETEMGLLCLVNNYNSIEFPEEKIEQAVRLFSWYIENPSESFIAISQHAARALLIVDYGEGIKMLPKAMDNQVDHRHFTLAWYLVQEKDPVILARDLFKNLNAQYLNYFVDALRFSSANFQDEKSEAFKKEIERLRK